MNDFSLTRQDTLVMKGIAIMAMLCHHLYGCPPNGVAPYFGVLAWLGDFGKVCVAIFLFCSAYGLSAQYEPKSIKEDMRFVARRLVKFYANYWVVFLIFVPITIFVFHRSLSDAYGAESNIVWCFFKDILGLQGYDSYNITWWFNRLIIIFYLLFPILYRVIRIQPIIAIVIGMIIMRLENHLPYTSVDICIWQFPFLVGIVWKLYEDKLSKVSAWLMEHKILFAISSLALFVIVAIFRMNLIIPHWSNLRLDAFLTGAIALMVISIGRYMPHTSSVFAFLGKHSMNIYLMHTFFNAFYCKDLLHSGEWLRGGGNFIVLMIICLLVSIIIEFLKEKIRFYELVNIITKHI